MLWPRPPCVRHVPALCAPCVRAASPHVVLHVSALCPPCARIVCAMCPRRISTRCPPRVRLVSALCPPYVRLVSALTPLWPRLHTLSELCPTRPPCVHIPRVSHVPAMCPHCVRAPQNLVGVSALSLLWRRSKLCPPCFRRCSAMCSRLSLQVTHVSAQAWALPLDFVRSWPGQGGGIIKKILSIAQPTRLYCMPAGQFPWRSFWFPKFGLCMHTPHPMFVKLFGVCAGIIQK